MLENASPCWKHLEEMVVPTVDAPKGSDPSLNRPKEDQFPYVWNKSSQDYSMHMHEKKMWDHSLHSPVENDHAPAI